MRLLSVCHLDHGKTQNLVAQLIALLEDLYDGVLADALVLDVHDGVVLLRIEGLILRGNLRHAELFEHGGKLLADHLHALPVGVAFFKLLRAALKNVPTERLWVNPDCGLKTRGYAEVDPSLRNLVAARDEVVAGL